MFLMLKMQNLLRMNTVTIYKMQQKINVGPQTFRKAAFSPEIVALKRSRNTDIQLGDCDTAQEKRN